MVGLEEKRDTPRYRWVVLLVSLLAFVAYAFSFQITPPLIPLIIKEFTISNAEAGLLMSVVLIPGLLLSIPVSFIVDKYGAKQVVFVSLLCVILGTLLSAVAGSYIHILIGRLILGVGGATILPATPTIISQWFPKQELGKAMGIFGINMPIATVVAIPTASSLSLTLGWRYPFYVSVILGIIITITFTLLIKDKPSIKDKEKNLRRAIRNPEIWKAGFVWLSFQASMLSLITWSPTLLEKFQGMSKIQAGLTTSVLSWITIILVPVYGFLSDHYKRKKIFIVAGSALMSLVFIAISLNTGINIIILYIALGISCAMIPPIIQTLPAEIFGPSMASLGFGVMTILGNMGPILAPPFVGYVLDQTNSYFYSIVIMSLFSAIGTLIGFFFKK